MRGNVATSDGNAVDRAIMVSMTIIGGATLLHRRLCFSSLVSRNKWLCLYYIFIGISAFWSDMPMASVTQWTKDIGNIIMVLIVLSEKQPEEAVRACIMRCSYLLVPASVLLIKYYPNIGRAYDLWTHRPIIVGATLDKNHFGATMLVFWLGLCWSFLDLRAQAAIKGKDRFAYFLLAAMTGWLLVKSNCATAILCTCLGTAILVGMACSAIRWRVLAFRTRHLVLIAGLSFGSFGFGKYILDSVGRDVSLTGRTDIWKRALTLNEAESETVAGESIVDAWNWGFQTAADTLFGAGYCGFLTTERAQKLSEGYYYKIKMVHNGYLETYLNCGLIGLTLLITAMTVPLRNIQKRIAEGSSLLVLRLAFLIAVALYNITETVLSGLSPIWFVFLLLAIEFPAARRPIAVLKETVSRRVAPNFSSRLGAPV
jgi:O-antigen ligase